MLEDYFLSDYKFTESEILSLEGRDEIRFAQQLNASDYRAMRYAFDGDLMFDSDYYIKEYDIDPNQNPFTDYNEQATDIGLYRNPNAVFDESFYNRNNPELAESVKTGLEDYMGGGWRVGLIGDPNYDPERNTDFSSIFSSEDYFTIHDDVRVESYDPEANSPLEDLMDFGFVEQRVFNKALKGDTLRKTSISITPDSDPTLISQVRENLAAKGISFEINDDNGVPDNKGFLVSQIPIRFIDDNGNFDLFQPIEDLTGAAAGALIGGITYYVVEEVVPIFSTIADGLLSVTFEDIAEGFAFAGSGLTISGYAYIPLKTVSSENDLVSISYGDPELEDLLRPLPFPEQAETQIDVEIFRPPFVDGVEDFTIFPLPDGEGFFPSTTGFPQRNELLEEILDGPFIFPDGEDIFQPFFNIAGGTFSANDKNLDVINDLGLARELKVARLIGGTKVVQPGRPKVDYKIQDPNNINIGLQIDVAGPNNELILVGGGAKANPKKITDTINRIKTLNKVAISRGVTPQAYFADNTPQSLLNIAAAELGQQNVFVFPEVLNSERAELSQLEIISDVIDFNK